MGFRLGIGNIDIRNVRPFDWAAYWAARYPSALSLTVISSTQINLVWTNNGAVDYEGVSIERSTDGITYAEIDTIVPGAAYSDTTCAANTLYYYRIRYYRGTHYSAYSNVVSGTTWMSQYQTVYNAFTTKPNAARDVIYNTMVKALVDGAYWPRFDTFHFHAAHINSAGEAHINWKLPGTYNSTAYNAPTFTADQGILGNGTTQYIDYNFTPSVNGINFIQDSASHILYIRTNIASDGYHGTRLNADFKNYATRPQSAIGAAGIFTNDNTLVPVANTDGSGLYFNTRTAAAVKKLYRNKVAIIETTTASIGVPTNKFFSLAYNANGAAGGFRADQIAIHILMNGCSQADVTAISDILNAAMTSLGTNVY